jgi:hypothetical protein
MQNRSMWTELAIDVLGTALLVAFAMLFLAAAPLTARASAAPNQGACHTPTEVRLTYEAHIPGLTTSVYRGADAAAFIRALIAEIGPPPPQVMIPERTVAVGTYIADTHVVLAFYENVAGMECWFFNFSDDTSNLQSVFKAMGRIGA